jgi:hypothetical protein
MEKNPISAKASAGGKTGMPAKASSNAGRYLKYAIGEIILVVFGILIALQINNWNEQRKQNQTYFNILKAIKSDMVIDTTNIASIIRNYKEDEYAFLLSKRDTINRKEYLECKECPSVLKSFQPIILQTRGYNRIQSFNSGGENEQDSLNSRINVFYATYISAIQTAINSTGELLKENNNLLRETKPWFKDWLEGEYNDDFYNYALHDLIYKNRVAQYYLYIYQYYLRILIEAKEHEEKLIKLIDEKLYSFSK